MPIRRQAGSPVCTAEPAIVDEPLAGCQAGTIISAGQRIGAVDADVCPVSSGHREVLPLTPA